MSELRVLSVPLDRLNAILSLLQPLDRYRTPSAIGSAIGRPYLALSRIHAQAGVLDRLVLKRLGGSTAPFKISAKHWSAAERRGLWEGVVQAPLRRALFCVFLCSEVIFSCKSHRNFRNCPSNAGIFWKTPSRKTPKRSC